MLKNGTIFFYFPEHFLGVHVRVCARACAKLPSSSSTSVRRLLVVPWMLKETPSGVLKL